MNSIGHVAFRNYFWTAQLIAGLSMALKMLVEGWKDSGPLSGLAWGVGGFLCVVPIAALGGRHGAAWNG